MALALSGMLQGGNSHQCRGCCFALQEEQIQAMKSPSSGEGGGPCIPLQWHGDSRDGSLRALPLAASPRPQPSPGSCTSCPLRSPLLQPSFCSCWQRGRGHLAAADTQSHRCFGRKSSGHGAGVQGAPQGEGAAGGVLGSLYGAVLRARPWGERELTLPRPMP